MPKVKPKRSVPSIDMTAMVDVAFLLLTFFILTTKFKAEEKAVVDLPSSIQSVELPATNVFIIKVAKDGKIFLSTADKHTRVRMLERVAEDFDIQYTEAGMNYFANSSEFGVPFNELSSWLSMPNAEEMKHYPQKGIPVDKRRGRLNELREWIQAARRSNSKLVFAIKGDRDVEYEEMEEVIWTLQDVNINRFNIVTNLEGDPGAKASADHGGGEGEH